jgi:hypothetical protein
MMRSQTLGLPSGAPQQHVARGGKTAECRLQSAPKSRVRAAAAVEGGGLLGEERPCMLCKRGRDMHDQCEIAALH